ncbi:MAG: class I SAM-dependent methyltransferase [Acidobacteria bacterium]|nr:class I SAM-dependent methyltransferase [Acidobacteriota bacterium]
MKHPASYQWLAEHYDEIFSFRSWMAPARERILESILLRVRTGCDLGCGTASTAIELARDGVRMYAVDLSAVMCRKAKEKVARAGVPVTVLRADMRTFRLPTPVDLVTCEFDAINHVPLKGDLVRVCKSVARALNPGGHFFFDVNHEPAFADVWPLTWWIDRPSVAVTMHGGYDKRRARGWVEMEGFVREGKLWRRHHDYIEEVCWTVAEIRAALTAAGFDRIKIWDAMKFLHHDKGLKRGHRSFCLARRAV